MELENPQEIDHFIEDIDSKNLFQIEALRKLARERSKDLRIPAGKRVLYRHLVSFLGKASKGER